MPDPIAPPVAHRAEEALDLVSQAFSDGDLDAALAQYEPSAQLQPWARPAGTDTDVRDTLRELMDLRLPLSLSIRETLQVAGLTVVMCERRIAGTGPDCEQIRLRGYGFAAVRPQPDGSWRIAIDSWCLEVPPEPPELPPGPESDDLGVEGPGRPLSTS
jgi:ketosteroid isomerase-like protein